MTSLEALWLRSYPDGVPRSVEYPALTLDAMLEKTATDHPGGRSMSFLGSHFTWAELLEMSRGFAQGLQSLGVQKGDRVAIALPNCPQMVAGIYGTLMARAVAVPVNPLYVEREIEGILRDSGANVIVALDRLHPRLQKVSANLPDVKVVLTHITDSLSGVKGFVAPRVARKKGNYLDVPGALFWKDVVRKGAPRPLEGDPQDLAVIQYTGGTTGTPKGAMLSHRNLVANAVQTHLWTLPVTHTGAPGRVVAVLPFFHVYGLTVALNASIYAGDTLILEPRFEVAELVDSIKKTHPTRFPGTPTMYIAVIQEATRRQVDLSSIDVCISGSAPLPLEVQSRFEEMTKGHLVEGYGLTEASPVTHCNPLTALCKNGTIGLPFPDTEGKIMTDDGREVLPGGEPGELWVKGPQIMMGYWNHPEESKEVLTEDGWLKTGDIATLDDDGYFRIVDRKKDLIICSGFNVYPREVEEVLYTHPDVVEASAFGVPDPYRGETVKVAIVLKEGAQADAGAFEQFCADRLARYKVPRFYEFRSSLPKSTIGKTLRRILREEHTQESKGAVNP